MDDSANTFPGRAYFSKGSNKANIPEAQNPNWWNTPFNFLDIGPDDGEPLMGMAVNNGVRYFFKSNQVFPVTGIAKADIVQEPPLSETVGATGPDAFTNGPDGNLWVLHYTGLYKINGRKVTPVPGPFDWAGLFASSAALDVHMEPIPDLNALMVTISSASDHFETWVYSIENDSWYEWDIQPTALASAATFKSGGGFALYPTLYLGLGGSTSLYTAGGERVFYLAKLNHVTLAGLASVVDSYAKTNTTGDTQTMDVIWESSAVVFAAPGESKHLYEVSIFLTGPGSLTTGQLRLQVSLDGTTWTNYVRQLTATDITNGVATVPVGARAERFYWRFITQAPSFTGNLSLKGIGFRVESSDPDVSTGDER